MKRRAILLGALLLSVGGCSLVEDQTPDEAHIVVRGETNKPVRIIISTKFVAAVNENGQTRVVLFEADTVVTTLPFERRVRINEDQRFFAEAARADVDLTTMSMEVAIDRRVAFAETGVLREGQPYRFVYTFNQFVTRDIVVI